MSSAPTLIRQARLEAGLTQAELAERLGVTQPAIAALERPGANPRMETVERTLACLGRYLRPAVLEAIDETQLRARLMLTPAERLEAFQQSNRRLRTLLSGARRVV